MDRNLACKTCGTKTFKISSEVDDHHKEAHPGIPNPEGTPEVADQDGEQQSS